MTTHPNPKERMSTHKPIDRELLERAKRYYRSHFECCSATQMLAEFADAEIEAAGQPKPVVWQHKPGCPTPYQWDCKAWRCKVNNGYGVRARSDKDFLYCDGCGAPRPQEPKR